MVEIKWKEGFNPDVVTKKIEEMKKVDEGGKINFSGWRVFDYQILLSRMIQFPDEIPDYFKKEFVRKSIFGIDAKKEINSKNLLENIKQQVKKYLEMPSSDYV